MRTSTLTGLFGLLSFAEAAKYGYNHVAVRQDSDIVAANFKDVDISLYSPAFLNPGSRLEGFSRGTEGPTSHEAMEVFMEEIAGRNSYMTYNTANFTSEELRSFPYVHLAGAGNSTCRRRSAAEKVRIWVQGAAHGNEPAGDEALLALLGKFDNDPEWAAGILEKVDIVILPRYNPDGVYYFQRALATNFDPNRDHIKQNRQQTRNIKSLLAEYNPHVIIDMHEYGATTQYGRYYHGSDGLFSAAKNLNINESIRSLSEEVFAKNIGYDMEDAGLRWEPYVTGPSSRDLDFEISFTEAGTDAKIGRNAMGLTQSVTFLIEMRGIFLADQEFQRRTAAGLTMAGSIIQTAADNADKVYETVEGGRDAFISGSDHIILTDSTTTENREFTMVDHTTGEIVQVPIKFISNTPAHANLTRSRPEAYLIPVAWADLAARLVDAGLEVETLSEPWSGTIEALRIESTQFESSYYEGAVRATVTTSTRERELTLPAGSFRVSTRQKNAALAFVALEPGNIDSYVSFNVVPVERGDEYPIFRVAS
ncbi:Carboxypeptidase 2 like protein [Verticillium longisporum]|uniref:Carboxypeptidase M14B n=1 Tax=Verticillium longisporum TaxID=100787 RepID=A0A0G4MS54_VERLO|nr:Carboxypeptidase 2 like protein [Verticillium longisporum]KAG7133876.1 Carboxypeptidase 2 like protein [Verticillium longisporum]CRK37066.1 hypothetical protein BN1723_015172 [Verticillium longisporum]